MFDAIFSNMSEVSKVVYYFFFFINLRLLTRSVSEVISNS